MKVKYHCDECNTAHDNPENIFKCQTCGAVEICKSCRYGPYKLKGKEWYNCYQCASIPDRDFRIQPEMKPS